MNGCISVVTHTSLLKRFGYILLEDNIDEEGIRGVYVCALSVLYER
jgi:hypothetical protein